MRRRHLIELHEQPWYPAPLKELFQAFLGTTTEIADPFDDLHAQLEKFIQKVSPKRILDLCSGSGKFAVDFWHRMFRLSKNKNTPQVILSDLYPNLESYRRLKDKFPKVDYYDQAVDALSPPEDTAQMWTMIEALHHFEPDDIKRILRNATSRTNGFIALETTNRRWINIFMALFFVPLLSAYLTAVKVKPWRFRNILWGILIPVIPLTATFDGIVSNLRSYTPEELQELTSDPDLADFAWETGAVKISRTPGLKINYLIGWRKDLGDTQ